MISIPNFIEARKKAGLNESELARRVGCRQSLVDQIESGKVKTSRYIFQFAKVMDVKVNFLDPAIEVGPFESGAVAKSGIADLPVYAAAQGGRGSLILSWDPVEYLPRISPLVTVRRAYGMHVIGDSMEPAYYPGDIVFINPHTPLRPNVDVLLFRDHNTAETEALLKRLVKITATDWHLEQFNPPQKFKLTRNDWQYCHRIVGKYNG